MYASLASVDLVVDGTDVGRIGIQTDHRTAAEIEASWDLSVVFAAVRARRPRDRVDQVWFACAEPPSARYAAFVAACGAELERTPAGPREPAAYDVDRMSAAVEDALLRLGAEALSLRGLPMDLDGLRALEAALRAELCAAPEPRDDAEIAVRVAWLAGAAAAVARAMRGGSLAVETGGPGAFPFAWQVDGVVANLLGRAESFLGDDPTVPPSQLVALLANHQRDAVGEVRFHLRPAGWTSAGVALTVPFPTRSGADDPGLPVVTVVVDLPESTRSIPADTPAADVARLVDEARRNGPGHAMVIEPVADGDPVLLVHGGYFAAERVLDTAFLRALGEQLADSPGAGMWVAVPRKGMLLARARSADPDDHATFAALVRAQFDRAGPRERLSVAVLAVDPSDGAITGVAHPPARTTPPASWWTRWTRA